MTDHPPNAAADPAARWTAAAVWSPGEAPKNSHHYFRAVFDVADDAAPLRLHISAETFYRVYLNGEYLGEGPPFGSFDQKLVDAYDLAAARPGPNCLAVVVRWTGHHLMGCQNRPFLMAEVTDAAGRVLTPPAAWRTRRADAWRTPTYYYAPNIAFPCQEVFDARRVPAGWMNADFDDRDWPPAAPQRIRRLRAREIPMVRWQPRRPVALTRVEQCLWLENRRDHGDLTVGLAQVGREPQSVRIENPHALVTGAGVCRLQCSTEHLHRFHDGVDDPAITLDFGEVFAGRVELDVEGPAGAMIDLGVAERLVDGYFNNNNDGRFADRHILAGGRETIRFFRWHAFRYAKLRVHCAYEPLTLHRCEGMERVYPVPAEGRFESDDPTLDRVFHICRRTLAMSGQEWITDSAWRESANWLGDASAVSVGGLHACFAETATTGKFLREAAGSQTASGLIAQVISLPAGGPTGNLPDYSLHWIEALYRHYLLTGDHAWARDFYPQVRRVLDFFEPYRDTTGLVADLDVATFCDWAPIDGCGYHLGRTEGAHAFLNALYHRALAAAIELARANDDSATVDRLQQRRDAVARSYVPRLYDAEAGLIADTVRGDRRSDRFSEQCNAMALAAGLLDDDLAAQVIDRAFLQPPAPLTEAQPFCTTFILQALARHGRFDAALDLIRARWGGRMLANGATSTWEEWGCNGGRSEGPEYAGYMRSQSHPWAAYPAEFLLTRLPRLTILEPGARRIRLDPVRTPFAYRLTLPLPAGRVRIDWNTRELHLDADPPIAIES